MHLLAGGHCALGDLLLAGRQRLNSFDSEHEWALVSPAHLIVLQHCKGSGIAPPVIVLQFGAGWSDSLKFPCDAAGHSAQQCFKLQLVL